MSQMYRIGTDVNTAYDCATAVSQRIVAHGPLPLRYPLRIFEVERQAWLVRSAATEERIENHGAVV